MDASIAGSRPGMGIGMESSIIGQRREMDESFVMNMNVTMGAFDLKDEEARMRAFLGMGAGRANEAESEGANNAAERSSSIRTAPKSRPSSNYFAHLSDYPCLITISTHSPTAKTEVSCKSNAKFNGKQCVFFVRILISIIPY